MARRSSIPQSLIECFDPGYVVSSDVREAYLKATFELSRADASKWATFVETFKEFTAYEYERALSASAGEAQVMVGMNRRMRDLRDDFIHIENLASKLKKQNG
jgi:hypothetical protein